MVSVFNEQLSLAGWMTRYGYHWVDGKEQMFKGLMGVIEAADLIRNLRQQGAITCD